MKLLKCPNAHSIQKPISKDRFAFIVDETNKLVIPVGPRFQVDVPSFGDYELDNSKWYGTLTSPMKRENHEDIFDDIVGEGMSNVVCECASPRSEECVKRHVFEKKFQLQNELGSAFWKWKFDEMGENVTKLWTLEEQKKFQYVVKMTTNLKGGSFMKFALQCLPCKSKKSIVSYYLNVYIPRRMRVETRLGFSEIDTDDDEEKDLPCPMGSRKRFQASNISSRTSKYIKAMYLTNTSMTLKLRNLWGPIDEESFLRPYAFAVWTAKVNLNEDSLV